VRRACLKGNNISNVVVTDAKVFAKHPGGIKIKKIEKDLYLADRNTEIRRAAIF